MFLEILVCSGGRYLKCSQCWNACGWKAKMNKLIILIKNNNY